MARCWKSSEAQSFKKGIYGQISKTGASTCKVEKWWFIIEETPWRLSRSHDNIPLSCHHDKKGPFRSREPFDVNTGYGFFCLSSLIYVIKLHRTGKDISKFLKYIGTWTAKLPLWYNWITNPFLNRMQKLTNHKCL